LPTALSAADLVARVPGTARIAGDPKRTIRGIASLSEGQADTLSFCDAGDTANRVAASHVSVVVVSSKDAAAPRADQSLIVVDDPREWFIMAVETLLPNAARPADPLVGVDPSARVHADAEISPSAAIGANVTIGSGTRICRGATIYADCDIGANCCIGPGAVVGWVGLAYHDGRDGMRRFFPHLAGVRIGDWVDVGANACICRGMLSHTIIGNQVKIGSLVYLSHGTVTEDKAWISASCAIAGHSHLGERALLGIGAVVVDNVTMAADTLVGGGSVLTRPAKTGEKLVGVPARHDARIRRFGPTPR
jgi:UDP-3-O-[3-hydroxymyristoyl] glucosamine N-acyltransferase